MPEVLNYTDQLRKRADRVADLERELAQAREELKRYREPARLFTLLRQIVDSAPGANAKWRDHDTSFRLHEPRYEITSWEWSAHEGRTPERFEEALNAAYAFVYGEHRTMEEAK